MKQNKTDLHKIKNIGVALKPHSKEAHALAGTLTHYLVTEGYRVFFDAVNKSSLYRIKKGLSPTHAKNLSTVPSRELSNKVDLILVLGGDGTLLRVARTLEKKSPPLLGVHMGTLGFLTEIKKEEAFDVLNRLLSGERFPIEERQLLEASVFRNKKAIFRALVVNDAVISKNSIARMSEIKVYRGHQFVSSVRADGIIVSSPTGSTAYSLAAGGPILDPTLSAVVVTPISPHSLTQRPIVFGDDQEIQVVPGDRGAQKLCLTIDGQKMFKLHKNDSVIVRRFNQHTLKLIASPSRDYFKLLREKFNFGTQNNHVEHT